MIETARIAARAAGKILCENYGKIPEGAVRAKSKTDFLSFVDENSEKAIIDIIRQKYPDHSILAEEGGAEDKSDHYRWIIDPLDGTTNYISGIPNFAVSIACEYKQELILGVIYDPLRGELFYAEKGQGAFLNGNKISVSKSTRLSQALLATGFPFKAKHLLQAYQGVFAELFQQCIGMRRIGAAAIDLAYVAAGRFDGFWELGLSPWDMAAGAVIIREAGGRVSDFWNQPHFLHNSYLIAGNSKIHEAICDAVQKHFPFFKPVNEA